MGKGRVFTKNDYERLRSIIENGHGLHHTDAGTIESLKRELKQSRRVDPSDIRPNIVTMNSKICLKNIGSGRKDVYSLVFPDRSDEKDSLSVFSRIGSQVVGNPIGTVVRAGHDGENYLMIEEILYQPEAFGEHRL